MCLCVYVPMYLHLCIYVQINVSLCVNVCIWICVCTCICICKCVCLWRCIWISIYLDIYASHKHIYIYVYTYTVHVMDIWRAHKYVDTFLFGYLDTGIHGCVYTYTHAHRCNKFTTCVRIICVWYCIGFIAPLTCWDKWNRPRAHSQHCAVHAAGRHLCCRVLGPGRRSLTVVDATV